MTKPFLALTLLAVSLGSGLALFAQDNQVPGNVIAEDLGSRGVPKQIKAEENAAEGIEIADTGSAPGATEPADVRTEADQVKQPAEIEETEAPGIAEGSGEVELTEETEKAPAKVKRVAAIPAIRTDVVKSRKIGGEKVVVAPLGSIFLVDDSYYVLAKGAESDIHFQQVEVELGKTNGFVVEILGGLASGDEVITVDADQLRFPSLGDCGEVCGPNGEKAGDCELIFSAKKFFQGGFDEGYGPGPMFGSGSFCPTY